MASESTVGTDLAELRRTVEDLDPGKRNLLTPKKLFGVVPFGNKTLTLALGTGEPDGSTTVPDRPPVSWANPATAVSKNRAGRVCF